MSVKVTACLHPASNDRTIVITEPGTVGGIIERLGSGFPLSSARACLNGGIVKDFSARAEDGDEMDVKFVPGGGGSPEDAGRGMKLGGAGLVFLGVLVAAASFWTGAGLYAGLAIVGSGVGLLAGGGALMNINAPSARDREKPVQDPSIRGGKNQARPGGRVPALFGRHRIYPDLAANPHTEIIGNSQYFTQLFCGGYRECVIDLESLKLGDKPLVDFSQTGDINQILAGADPNVSLEIIQDGAGSKLYPRCVHEDAVNAELKHETEDAEGNMVSGAITRRTPGKTTEINVDIFFYNGLGKYDKDGNVVPREVEVKAEYRKAGSSSWTRLGYFGANNSDIISGAKLQTKRCQVTKTGLEPGEYEVRLTRVTPDSAGGQIIDQVYAGSVRSKKPAPPVSEGRRKDLALVALRLLATAGLSGTADSFNYIATSKLPAYSGTGTGEPRWAAAETRNPASMLLYALRGRAAQQRVDPEDIDWPSFERFYEWCEERGYYCDAYLSGAADTGAVSTRGWKQFDVYNDAEAEPALPAGDGQTGGWHYARTARSVWQSSKTAKTVESGAWGAPVRIAAYRGTDDLNAVYLTLQPPSFVLDYDADGVIIAGSLPKTAQARLFKWNAPITSGVAWSLEYDPPGASGASVNASGLVTVSAAAALADKTVIKVKAAYAGETYSDALVITKNRRHGPAVYLGAVSAIPATAAVNIITGGHNGPVTAGQGDYVLAVQSAPDGQAWKAGYAYQWTGVTWEPRDPGQYSELYIRCFKDGLDFPGLAQDMGWFGNLFAKALFAQQAYIEKLESVVVKISGAIYGGDRYDKDGVVVNAASDGWWLGPDGALKAKGGDFAGKITAASGTLDNVTVNQNCTVKGALEANSVVVDGVHAEGPSFLITADNRRFYKDNLGEVTYKVLRIAGKGSCSICFDFAGRVYVDVYNYDTDIWDSLYQGTNDYPYCNEIERVAALGKNTNLVRMSGMKYGLRNFENTYFEARSSSAPGIFAFMSGTELPGLYPPH